MNFGSFAGSLGVNSASNQPICTTDTAAKQRLMDELDLRRQVIDIQKKRRKEKLIENARSTHSSGGEERRLTIRFR